MLLPGCGMKDSLLRAVPRLAIGYLVGLVILSGFMHFDTVTRWPVTLFLFSPRWVVAVPLLILVPITLATRSRLTWLYLIHAIIIIFPILGYRGPWTDAVAPQQRQVLRVMTCNLGAGAIRIDQLMSLAQSHDVHVLMLQECPSTISAPLFRRLGWNHRQESNVAIGSLYELGESRILGRQPASHNNAVAAVSCEVRLPAGNHDATGKEDATSDPGARFMPSLRTVHLVSLHLPTFRPALMKAWNLDLHAGTGINDMSQRYRSLTQRILRQVHEIQDPIILAGDLNIPVESAFYRNHLSGYRNAFSSAGRGLGYTKYTRFHGIRIDHVLLDSQWDVHTAIVGPGVGGDHRPVIVELSLNDPPSVEMAPSAEMVSKRDLQTQTFHSGKR